MTNLAEKTSEIPYYLSIPNKLIVIGYTGNSRCYLNITVEEAICRYCEVEGIPVNECCEQFDVYIKTIEFLDEFGAYAVYN